MVVVYDDDEGMLKDQGLEVVVIPYRQSPPKVSRPPLSPNRNNRRRRMSNDDTVDSSSPSSDDDDDEQQNNQECITPPPPPKQLFTPRSRSLIQEVTGHVEEIDTPPIIEEKKNDGSSIDNNKKAPTPSNRVGRSTMRSQSVGRPTKNKTTTTKPNNNNPHAKSYPETIAKPKTTPRLRSKSTPPQSKSTKLSPLRNQNDKLTFVQMAKLGYQELCNAIIRPPRSNYPLSALGPEEFVFCNTKFVRKDFGIVNERGLLLECSMWKKKDEYDGYDVQQQQQHPQSIDKDTKKRNNRLEHGELILNVDDWDESKEKGQMYLHVPESFEEASTTSSYDDDNEYNNKISDNEKDDKTSHQPELLFNISGEDESPREMPPHSGGRRSFGGKRRRDPVVIYLHGNSSGRTEVIPQLGHLLSLGVSVVAFDFAGSGKSEGEFVSLGYYEREDLHTVIKHLRASGDVSTIALWGRSMGAATAIMYGSRDPTISCMILDSSFTDLTQLATEMVERGKEQGVNVPGFVVSVALRMIKNSIKSQAGFSIRHLSPISHANRCFIPSMFVAGEHDDFIKKRHSEKLHAKYAGDKNILVVDGDHNSPRPRFLLQSACLFLQSCMQLPPSLELVVPLGTNLRAPPWICPGTFSRLMNKAMQGSSATSKGSDGRNWIRIDGVGQQQKQLQRQRTQPPSSMKSSSSYKSPPGMPLEKYSRSMSDAASPTTEDYCGASELPDMSERQKEIQSSLFKMLGQRE